MRSFTDTYRDTPGVWTAVHEPFMSRDLTRDDVRYVVGKGLERAGGNYKALLKLFNMPPRTYRRFLSFLSTHQCGHSLHRFRGVPSAAATGTDR